MKRLILKAALIATSIMAISATALAYTDTSYFTVGRLVLSTDTPSGYRVYPASGYSLPTSQGCTYSDYAEMANLSELKKVDGFWVSSTSPEATLMNHTLLGAFLAGRKVKLRLDGCAEVSKRPLYRIVTLSSSQ